MEDKKQAHEERMIHRAGLYAYVFEALVFSASIAAYFLLA